MTTHVLDHMAARAMVASTLIGVSGIAVGVVDAARRIASFHYEDDGRPHDVEREPRRLFHVEAGEPVWAQVVEVEQ